MNIKISESQLGKLFEEIAIAAYQAGYKSCLEDVQPYAPEFVKDVYECWSKG